MQNNCMKIYHQMQRLQNLCLKNGPLCIGLDTDPTYIPPNIIAKYKTAAKAVLAYNDALIKACAPYVACAKVQIAYYEAMGLEGLKTYCETLKILKENDIPIISDVKRGDIADTAKAYARAHFSGDFESDIITVNPYMGFDTLEPFTAWCGRDNGKGIFVLLRTSNPGMKDIENLDVVLSDANRCGAGDGDGGAGDASRGASNGSDANKKVFEKVGDELLRLQSYFAKEFGYNENDVCSPVGAVVGCTEEDNAKKIRNAYPNIFFLIPGYGAQGGKAKIAGILLNKAGGVVNSSRGILCAWKKDEVLAEKEASSALTLNDIVESAKRAAQKSKEELLAQRLNVKNRNKL